MPRHVDVVKARLLECFESLLTPLLESADSKQFTVRTAEQACWEAVLPLGAELFTNVLGLRCRAESVTLVEERGWTLGPGNTAAPVARFRLDDGYFAKLWSTFGRVAVPLFALRTPGAGTETIAPARDLFPHRKKMRSTELMLEWECAVGADQPFRKAAEALRFFTHGAVDIEDTTIERHAVTIGNAVPTEWLYQAPEAIREILATRAVRDTITDHPIIYASTDAHALKRFVDDRWNPKWKMSNGIRVWTVDKKTGKTIHLGGEYTWGDCLDVRKRFQRLRDDGVLPINGDFGEGVVAQIALLTDGLDWIADYVLTLFPGAVAALDPFHVLHHVADAAKKAWPGKKHEKNVKKIMSNARRALGVRKRRGRTVYRKGPRRTRYKVRKTGFDGSGQRLLDEVLKPLLAEAQRGKSRIKTAIAYVTRNLYRLDYAELRTRGFCIGSGAMESLHRTGSQVRLKRAGCNWTAEAAQGILNLRMLSLSGRWQEYWSQDELPHLKPLGLAA